MSKRFAVVASVAIVVAFPCQSFAKARGVPPRHHRQHTVLHAAPSVDAVILSTLSPPSNRTTREQTYGDADFARARQQRRIANAPVQIMPDALFGIDPCDAREARAAGYACAPTQPGYGGFYAYLPANASAPQVPRGDPSQQSSILAPATALSWAVNAIRLDPHN